MLSHHKVGRSAFCHTGVCLHVRGVLVIMLGTLALVAAVLALHTDLRAGVKPAQWENYLVTIL